MNQDKINWNYGIAVLLAVFFTWIVHEFAHWVTGELLAYKMIMTLNGTYPASGIFDEASHALIISTAGPIITIVQAIVVLLFLR